MIEKIDFFISPAIDTMMKVSEDVPSTAGSALKVGADTIVKSAS
jgi:hypothetical protein